MKKANKIISIVTIVIIVFVLYLSVGINTYAENIKDLIPKETIWGISRDVLKENKKIQYDSCEVGGKSALCVKGISVGEFSLDCYYVFGEHMRYTDGVTYNGLSKITYILSGTKRKTTEELNDCYHYFVDGITKKVGKPDSSNDSKSEWDKKRYKIVVGKGKFKNYNGSDNKNVAIVFSAIDIPRGGFINPNPTPTPKTTSLPRSYKKSATPSPTPKSLFAFLWETEKPSQNIRPTKTPKPTERIIKVIEDSSFHGYDVAFSCTYKRNKEYIAFDLDSNKVLRFYEKNNDKFHTPDHGTGSGSLESGMHVRFGNYKGEAIFRYTDSKKDRIEWQGLGTYKKVSVSSISSLISKYD